MTRANPDRTGRPSVGDNSGESNKITFRVDDETETALAALEERYDGGKWKGNRSRLLRRLILDSFKKLTD